MIYSDAKFLSVPVYRGGLVFTQLGAVNTDLASKNVHHVKSCQILKSSEIKA